MVILKCPNCGERNVSEFRYGGEYNPRPAKPLEANDADWADFIFMQKNKLGVQKEWWFHRSGCGSWFMAERHTNSNAVEATYEWSADISAGGGA